MRRQDFTHLLRMISNYSKARISLRLVLGGICLALVASCATAPRTARGPEYAPTASLMRAARCANVPVETRAADYLQAAAITAPLLGTGIGTPACDTYNAACGELTLLLRSAEGGRLWDRPLRLTSSSDSYRLRLQPTGPGVWAPDYFTSFKLPSSIKETLIKKENVQQGVGGALVGVRMLNPREEFAPRRGSPLQLRPRSILKDVTRLWRCVALPSNL